MYLLDAVKKIIIALNEHGIEYAALSRLKVSYS
jgi:hypothetical protein